MSRVMIHPATYETVGRAIDKALDLFPIPIAGKTVLIKPNVLRASAPEEAITTHPAVLRAVVDKIEGLSPSSVVVGDNPGIFGYGANEEAFRKSGLMEAAKGYYRNIGTESREVAFNPEFMPTVSVSSAVLAADVIISLPKFKTHGLSIVTGAIKNSYGFLPGAQKARLHRAAGCAERFHEMLVDVFRLRVADLFIIDAVVGMEGNGPASTDLRDIGLILASDNGAALDSVVAFMMGLDPGRLRFLRKAKEMGLGDYDIGKIEVVGKLRRLPDFKVPPLGGEAILEKTEVQALLHGRTLMRPRANKESCTGCGTCVDQCPVSALSMRDGLPEVDADTCITCFCCQEMCPEKAIALQ